MIKKVVIPAAGLGTRFLPVTKNQPKEMLPIYNKPAIQYVIEEAFKSNLNEILIITGKDKYIIEEYFDRKFELEEILRNRGEYNKLNEINSLIDSVKFFYTRQNKPRGLGDAIYCSKTFIDCDEAFAVMLADEIFEYKVPPIKTLIDAYNSLNGIIIGLKRVEVEKVNCYGIIKGKEIERNLFLIEDMIEKPNIDNAPSNIAIVGRYILKNSIFAALEKTKPGKNGEIQLTDAIKNLIGKEKVYGVIIDEKRFDVGEIYGLLVASLYFSLKDEKISKKLVDDIQKMLNEKV